MADWINRVAEEEKRRIDAQDRVAGEVREIQAVSRSLMEDLENRVQRDVDHSNRQLYQSAKVFEVRHDMGLLHDERVNDFAAMTSDYPSATMYVKLDPTKRVLTRLLVTRADGKSAYQTEKLSEIQVTLDDTNKPVFLDPNWTPDERTFDYNGLAIEKELPRRLDLDQLARLILEPVVTAHTGIQTDTKSVASTAQVTSAGPAQAVAATSEHFSFVSDRRIAEILERDYEELQGLDPDESKKSVLVLSGGIIEGLLLDALVLNGNYTFEVACNEPLKNMIYPALKANVIKQDKLTDVLRGYRNLIHPAREIRDGVKFTASDAKLAIHAVDIIIGEVSEWHSHRKLASSKGAT